MSYTVQNLRAHRGAFSVRLVKMSQTLRAAGISLCEMSYKHKYTLKRICIVIEMLCCSNGAELCLGLAFAEGLGEQLLWSVNTNKVQMKQ